MNQDDLVEKVWGQYDADDAFMMGCTVVPLGLLVLGIPAAVGVANGLAWLALPLTAFLTWYAILVGRHMHARYGVVGRLAALERREADRAAAVRARRETDEQRRRRAEDRRAAKEQAKATLPARKR